MAAKRKKKKGHKVSRKPISYASGNDIAEFSGNDSELKITPFASLKDRIKSTTVTASAQKSSTSVPASRRSGSDRVAGNRTAVAQSVASIPQRTRRPSTDSNSSSQAVSEEERLFLEAMQGVTPLDDEKRVVEPGLPPDNNRIFHKQDEDRQCTRELTDIIEGKKDIPVEHTPEYVEGPAINSNPRIVRKLRRGKFSVQGYCDLHGLTTKDAFEWCEEFMVRSIAANRSCIAIIHGRGLSSPKGPVLKKMVEEWLTKGRWRRHVIAYSSAPSWDGVPCVTYVLLRQKPAPKKRRGKPQLWSE